MPGPQKAPSASEGFRGGGTRGCIWPQGLIPSLALGASWRLRSVHRPAIPAPQKAPSASEGFRGGGTRGCIWPQGLIPSLALGASWRLRSVHRPAIPAPQKAPSASEGLSRGGTLVRLSPQGVIPSLALGASLRMGLGCLVLCRNSSCVRWTACRTRFRTALKRRSPAGVDEEWPSSYHMNETVSDAFRGRSRRLSFRD